MCAGPAAIFLRSRPSAIWRDSRSRLETRPCYIRRIRYANVQLLIGYATRREGAAGCPDNFLPNCTERRSAGFHANVGDSRMRQEALIELTSTDLVPVFRIDLIAICMRINMYAPAVTDVEDYSSSVVVEETTESLSWKHKRARPSSTRLQLARTTFDLNFVPRLVSAKANDDSSRVRPPGLV